MEKLENQNLNIATLIKYGTNLTQLAKEGKLDPVIGRESEMERVMQILCKKRKNNPCLIGDPGVGKTVIVEGLATNIVTNAVPQKLKGNKVFSLEMGRLIAGAANRGEFEERLTMVVDEVKQSNGSIILFIDELHTLVGAGGSSQALDASNILKPALARGELKCIGATTLDEYKKYIEKDGALKRRFQPVDVPEPSVEQAIQILKGLSSTYESYHNVKYEYEAIVAAVSLSKQYISDRFLPDKAIDLMDEAGAKLQLQNTAQSNNFVVTEAEIRKIVSTWTGIPVEKVTVEELERLLNFENDLRKHVVGQDEAVEAISRAIRRARVGLRDSNKPIASFFFTGPTGVGKTEIANALAIEYFGSKKAMVRLDMSEYMERHSVSKLFGSPPGYVGYDEGGQLSEAVRRRAHTVILFDEIEKAHKDVCNVLLQILDTGNLTDAKGGKIDFKNTIIIMTSNTGQELIFKSNSYEQLQVDIAEELKKKFPPEFLNRIDEVIVFKKLEKEQLLKIVDVMLKDVYERLEAKNIKVVVSKKFKEKLINEGYSVSYGARPLRRAIVRLLEDPVAEKMLKGIIKDGGSVLVTVDGQGDAVFLNKFVDRELNEK